MGDYTHVANSPQAWGKGDHDDEAFLNMAGHVKPDRISGGVFEFSIVTARGDADVEWTPFETWTEADEVVSVSHFEMPVETLRNIREQQTDLEIALEEALEESRTETERPDTEDDEVADA